MTQSMSFLIQALPMPCFVLDSDLKLVCFNQAARAEFENPEHVLSHCLTACSEFLDEVGSYESEFEGVPITLTYVKDDARYLLFLAHHQELSLLQVELQSLKKPQRQLIQTLQNMVSTAKGYSELIAVMLEENQLVAGERLSAIRRYEQYVNDHLMDMEGLLGQAANSKLLMGAQLADEAPLIALVSLSNPVRSELVAELFRAQGMTARIAKTPALAAAALLENHLGIRLLVSDAAVGGLSEWREANPEASMIVCGGFSARDEISTAFFDRCRALPDQPMDINQMLRAAIDLLND
ncbi:MAG: hypothetical protein QNL18_13405 [Pseudomonadales bacterium]